MKPYLANVHAPFSNNEYYRIISISEILEVVLEVSKIVCKVVLIVGVKLLNIRSLHRVDRHHLVYYSTTFRPLKDSCTCLLS